ncbi:hypothetical protein [Halioglobus sp. Uisw_031]|uniref:hypothetical protein n=1 Tax=Halioglobus sp. Uisw_031 TaxID=3230977 RepID=UPI0039E9F2CA
MRRRPDRDFARHANSPAPTPKAFVAFLDTPARIIIEVVPQKTITFDGGVMRDTTSEALKKRASLPVSWDWRAVAAFLHYFAAGYPVDVTSVAQTT